MGTELAVSVEPPPDSTDWLGFAPATASDIEAAERRLGLVLPPSYRAFLMTSNGWRRTTPFIDRIRPIQEIDWFAAENEQWIEAYSDSDISVTDAEYYCYSEDGTSGHRTEYMPSLLQISDVDDGVYLLNPEGVTPDQEWEAWFFANWVPGALRFPSFAHLMIHEYQSFVRLLGVSDRGKDLPKLPAFAADIPRRRAERVRQKKKAAQSPLPEELILEMQSTNAKQRAKAVRAFCGKLRGRPNAKRRPDLVQPLIDLFYGTGDASVRAACISGLTELADDGDAPAPLLAALSDSDAGVVLSGIFALTYFPDKRAVEPLCRFVDSRVNALFNENAMSQLGEMGDEQAVPTLLNVLLDTTNPHDQSFGTAAIALARCGPSGFDALVMAHGHDDPRVRWAAVVGLDVSGDPRAESLLESSKFDADSLVRDRAKFRVGNLFRH